MVQDRVDIFYFFFVCHLYCGLSMPSLYVLTYSLIFFGGKMKLIIFGGRNVWCLLYF